MQADILYAYVDGSDLHEVAANIESRLGTFIGEHRWLCSAPTLVNQRHPSDPDADPEDLPDWDLGVSLALPTDMSRAEDFLEDLAALSTFLGQLYRETARDFVIGLASARTGQSEDCLYIGDRVPDRSKLRSLL